MRIAKFFKQNFRTTNYLSDKWVCIAQESPTLKLQRAHVAKQVLKTCRIFFDVDKTAHFAKA
jgi:hypothetical protein